MSGCGAADRLNAWTVGMNGLRCGLLGQINLCALFAKAQTALETQEKVTMTLLERLDRYGITATFKDGVKIEEIREAIAIAQAMDEWEKKQGLGLVLGMVKRRADELLRGEP